MKCLLVGDSCQLLVRADKPLSMLKGLDCRFNGRDVRIRDA